MRTDPAGAAPGAAPAGDLLPAALLVITPEADAPVLLGALAAAGPGAFRVTLAHGIGAALRRLRTRRFDAVLLDVELQEAQRSDAASRVREASAGAALILVGRNGATREAAAALGADEWIVRDDTASAIGRCLRGAVERRRLRRELEASDARFRSIVQRAADGVVIVGEDRRVRFVNPAAERLFGRGAAELAGQEFGFAAVAGETAEIDVLRRGEAGPLVAELRVSDTTWDGAPAQVVSLRDVTDRRRAEERAQRLLLEQAAREQAEGASRRSRFLAEAGAALSSSLAPETTLSSLARLIVPRLADWCVIDLLEGDRIRRVAGVHADPDRQELLEELKRRYPPRLDSPQPGARVLRSGAAVLYRELDGGALRGVAVDEAHAQLLSRLGVRSAMAVPLDAREERLGAITFVCAGRPYDESDLALAEEIASRAGQALENARLYEASLAANQAKSDFLALVSHELRTPLNAILGYVQLLLDGISGRPDPAQAHQLQRIHFSANHLLQIIEQILAYAEIEAGSARAAPRTVRLGELLGEIAAAAEPLLRDKGLEFHLDVRHPDAPLFTDGDKLRKITLHLLSNAVKFTEAGTVGLSAEVRGDDLVIAVADTGPGIAPEYMDTMFEPFRPAERVLTRRTGGAGLGLSVSQRLAQMLGGAITATSEPGVGSTFTVRVPARIPIG